MKFNLHRTDLRLALVFLILSALAGLALRDGLIGDHPVIFLVVPL